MKKYLVKFTALSVAALMSVCALASCGTQTDESNTPETTETTESTDKQEPAAETDVQTDNTEK